MTELGLIINCKAKIVKWEELKITMTKDRVKLSQKQLQVKLVDTKEPAGTIAKRKRLIKIHDAEYERANLTDFVDTLDHLDSSEQANLSKLLQKYKHLFDDTLGDFKTLPVRLESKKDAVPSHSRPFPVPRIHLETFKKKIERLV